MMSTPRAADLWPDTSQSPAPTDHHYRTAVWLLGRHPQLAELADRAGVTSIEVEGRNAAVDVNLDQLAAGFRLLDADRLAWADYRARTSEPASDAAYDDWLAAGPQLPDSPEGHTARALGPMSRTEVSRLRLLAFWCDYAAEGRVGLGIFDFAGMDAAGERLILDWLEAIRADAANGAATYLEERFGRT